MAAGLEVQIPPTSDSEDSDAMMPELIPVDNNLPPPTAPTEAATRTAAARRARPFANAAASRTNRANAAAANAAANTTAANAAANTTDASPSPTSTTSPVTSPTAAESEESGGPSPDPSSSPAAADDAWANLDLGEASRYLRNSRREAQEAAWSNTNIDARQIWGVREAQRLHGGQLVQAVSDLGRVRTLMGGASQRGSLVYGVHPPLLSIIMDFEGLNGDLVSFVAEWPRDPVGPREEPSKAGGEGEEAKPDFPELEICVRKRPMLEAEVTSGARDSVEVIPRSTAILCHDGRLSRSSRHLNVAHRHFVAHRVWGPKVQTKAVYEEVVQPKLLNVLKGGGATLLCMGQTGTGKTYTITGIMECLAQELHDRGIDVTLEFFEIYGKKCCDLLQDRKEIFLRADGAGKVNVRGQRSLKLPGGSGLAEAVSKALQLRSFEATERNAASSRSHAVCTLRFGRSPATAAEASSTASTAASTAADSTDGSTEEGANEEGRKARGVGEEGGGEGASSNDSSSSNSNDNNNSNDSSSTPPPPLGVLRLVDLAGSERNFETTKMTAKQHRESALINASLMTLKECFRAHAALQRGERVRMPFRGSQLTQVLRECFVDVAHSTSVIATISPTGDDVIHTINTLNHATMLSKRIDDLTRNLSRHIPLVLKGSAYMSIPMLDWGYEECLAWLQEVENGRFAHVVVPPTLHGKKLLKSSVQGLSNLFEGQLRMSRRDEEGEAWNIGLEREGERLGRAIFAAARATAMEQGL